MREDIVLWVKALRSGDYKQTGDTLQDDEGFCCHGVYAHVMKLEGWEKMNVDSPDYLMEEIEKRDSCLGDVSMKPQGHGTIYDQLQKHLTSIIFREGMSMNDGGYSFKEIADRIEEHYNG